jgi:hypothetical protein
MRRVRLFSSGGYEARWVANGSKFTFRLDDGSVVLCDAHGSAEFHRFLKPASSLLTEVTPSGEWADKFVVAGGSF